VFVCSASQQSSVSVHLRMCACCKERRMACNFLFPYALVSGHCLTNSCRHPSAYSFIHVSMHEFNCSSLCVYLTECVREDPKKSLRATEEACFLSPSFLPSFLPCLRGRIDGRRLLKKTLLLVCLSLCLSPRVCGEKVKRVREQRRRRKSNKRREKGAETETQGGW